MIIKVAIVDYGLGNLFSIDQACRQAGLSSFITSDVDFISTSDALILPGVGAFGDAMNSLKVNNLVSPIHNFVQTGKPFMGICLGMQLLFTESEEFGKHVGLNLIPGRIVRFPQTNSDGQLIRVPQIQWNQIRCPENKSWQNSVLKDIPNGSYMHFVHSYYAIPDDAANILSTSKYEGIEYTSAVVKDNITGIQYHPEKSAGLGIKIYENWAHYIKNKSY
jgi:glutamine amidotransferase